MPKKDLKELQDKQAKINEFLKKFSTTQSTRALKKAIISKNEADVQYKFVLLYIDDSEGFVVDPINYEPYIGYSGVPITEEMISNAVDCICADYGFNYVRLENQGEIGLVIRSENTFIVPTLRYDSGDYISIRPDQIISNIGVVLSTKPVLGIYDKEYMIGIYNGEA